MKIPTRIALVAVVVTLPQILGLLWWDGRSRHAAAAAVLGSMVERAAGEPGAEAACLEAPEAWVRRREGPVGGPPGGPPREGAPEAFPSEVIPPELRAYALDGGAPALAALEPGVITPLSPSIWGKEVQVGLRTGWGGPCEVLVARGTTVPGFLGSVLPTSPIWIAPILLVVSLMGLAVAPSVRRLRALTQAVRGGSLQVAMPGDDEVAELSRAFEASAQALAEEVERRRAREQDLREFVANTAHDVRVPLTVLRGHLAALEQGPDAEALRRAAVEAHYLGALIDNLAAQARMDAARPRERFDLGALAERVRGRHQPIARRRQVSLEIGLPPESVEAVGDLTLAEQALSNLVDNAIRHHRPGGHVALTLDVEGGRFALRVVDDGPGVAPEELARLQERGYRAAGARDRGDRGSGLGLHIVARVAEEHGWGFTLRPAEEGGLEACLSGPIAGESGA
ncbi:MAG: HAMP domain-containing histidine kinase [Alphaproteobacteria bacterium]|nr:HAMP domain-containing histidine kinase [Alphaproteobacteria bacterium]